MNCHLFVRHAARPIICLFTLLIGITLYGCSGDHSTRDHSTRDHSTPLIITGVDQQPHIYQDGGKIVGLDVDIATLATGNAGVEHSLVMESSFTDAYNKTKAGPNRALLGINYSKERKDDFKWVGPTSKSEFYIFAKKSAGIGSSIGLEACKKIESIAVVGDGWLETITLENFGFKNLRYYPTYKEALAAFDRGDVKAMASEMLQMGYATAGKYAITDIDFCMCYKTTFSYMAFSKDVDDSVINSIQGRLDVLIASGKTYEILKTYVPEAIPQISPGLLQLFTEKAPPYNFRTGPLLQYQTAGSSVDIVNTIQTRIGGYVSSIDLVNWFDGYANALELPNSALFTTARTDEREKLFQWVGPIATMTPRFYTLKAKNITAATLNDAKSLRVSTPDQWYTYDYLVKNGFGKIVGNAYTAVDAFKQMLDGTSDALLIEAESIDWLCNDTGTSRDTLSQLPITDPAQLKGYIAFSLNTPHKTVAQWQSALDAMKADGAFDRILLRWGLAAP
jgi:polar amino acid transport system substrate-binding protein